LREIEKLMAKGNKFLSTRVPIMCGAMTWVSDVHLVRIIKRAGAFGVLASGNMPPEQLESNIDELKKPIRYLVETS